MNNMTKNFKKKAGLRCMANGGLVGNETGKIFEDSQFNPDGSVTRSFSDAKYRTPNMREYQPQAGAPQIFTGGAIGAKPLPANIAMPQPLPLTPKPVPQPSSLGPTGYKSPGQNNSVNPLGQPGFLPPGVSPTPATPYQKARDMTSSQPQNSGSIGSRPTVPPSNPGMGYLGQTGGPSGTLRNTQRTGAMGYPLMTTVGYADGGAVLRTMVNGVPTFTQAPRLPSAPPPRPFSGMAKAKKTFKAEGGPVRGPGGPTDDVIPAMLSAGEYVLPADTVKAVGKEKLDKLKAATHEPSGNKATFRNGLRRHADGVYVEDPRLKNSQLADTAALLGGQPMPPPPAKTFVEKPLPPKEESSSPTMTAAYNASLVAPPNETTAGAYGRALRGSFAGALAPVEAGARYMAGSFGALKDNTVDLGRGIIGATPEKRTTNTQAEAPVVPANLIGPPAPKPVPGGAGNTALYGGHIVGDGKGGYTNANGAAGGFSQSPTAMGPFDDAAARQGVMDRSEWGQGQGLRSRPNHQYGFNMPSQSAMELRAINKRFDDMSKQLRMNFPSNSKAPSKMYRTLALMEQARANAIGNALGYDSTLRGHDTQRGMNDADIKGAQELAHIQGMYGLQAEGLRGALASAGKQMDPTKDPERQAIIDMDKAFASMSGDPAVAAKAQRFFASNQDMFPKGTDMREAVAHSVNMAGIMESLGLPDMMIGDIPLNPDATTGPRDTGLGERFDEGGVGPAVAGIFTTPGGDDAFKIIDSAGGEHFAYIKNLTDPQIATLHYVQKQREARRQAEAAQAAGGQ